MISKLQSALAAQMRAAIKDKSGASAVEFALLAPVFFVLFFGILLCGVYLQNLNAVQSLASDGARYVMVEYQKDNQVSDEQIRSVILARAVNSPYLLNTDRLQITVDRSGTSRITGATEIDVELRYTLPDFLPTVDLPGSTIVYTRSAWVAT